MPEPASARRPGTLRVVATPIGNLEDITLRALRVLREADLVAAEDTRHTGNLLRHFGIDTALESLHEHNESRKAVALVERMMAGADVALVSDAGTPAVSDPGYRVVRAAIEAGIRVEAVPGPNAALAALTCSGLPTDSFVFLGFPPPKARARRVFFESVAGERRTLLVYEAPHRIVACLECVRDALGDRDVVVARELTKLHEEVVRGRVSEVLGRLGPPRGEYTVVIGGAAEDSAAAAVNSDTPQNDEQILNAYNNLVESGSGRRAAIVSVARRFNLRAKTVFDALERARHS